MIVSCLRLWNFPYFYVCTKVIVWNCHVQGYIHTGTGWFYKLISISGVVMIDWDVWRSGNSYVIHRLYKNIGNREAVKYREYMGRIVSQLQDRTTQKPKIINTDYPWFNNFIREVIQGKPREVKNSCVSDSTLIQMKRRRFQESKKCESW
eukprot:UN23565